MSTTSLLPAGSSPTDDQLPPTLAALAIRPWPDGVIDALGFDPRSSYVEQFWLGILGPSTTWLLRRLATGLDAAPDGFELDLAATATALGLGSKGGRHSPFMRSLARCCQFDLAEFHPEGALLVRRKVPPLNRRQVQRLPEALRAAHEEWQQAQLATPATEQLRTRCRRLALSLFELGEDVEATERQLLRWKFHPVLCRESAAWASDRHRQALSTDGDQRV
ncbi:MAG: hypothetical protein ACRD0Q_12000 [Acidimicrobiales bacterium]